MSKDKNKKEKAVDKDFDEAVKDSEKTTANQEKAKQNGEEESESQKDTESKQEKEKEEKSEVEVLKEDLSKEKDKYMRLFAEFENYKRRTSKERVEMFKTAGQEVVSAMLPVLDDFDRALIEIKKSSDKGLLEGVELINNKLRETLKKKGLERMKVKEGDKFDADLHEAVSQIPAPKKKLKGKIVDVVEKGYILGDKIIRYPKVVTGK